MLGEPPFDLTFEIKCIGIPSSNKSSDEIILLNFDVDVDKAKAAMYVYELFLIINDSLFDSIFF